MKKIFSLLLVLIMLLGVFPACTTLGEESESQESIKTNNKVTLHKVGTVSVDALQDAEFMQDGIVAVADEKYQILDYLGNNALGEVYDYVTPLGKNMWLVYQSDKGRNAWGLVKADGTVLIPVSAALIEQVGNGINPRFLEVVYATEQVSDENVAYLKGSASPYWNDQKEDEYYKGYSLYYDLESGQFVGDLRRTDTGEALSVFSVGDKLFFERRDMIYDRSGNAFMPFSGYSVGDFFIDQKDKTCILYDCNMNEIASFAETPSEIYLDGQLFAFYDYELGKATVCDQKGTQIGEISFERSPYQYGSFLFGNDAENPDYTVVTDLSGKTILDSEAKVTYIEQSNYGYLELTFSDGSKGLLRPDGTVLKGASNNWDLLLFADRDQGSAMMILNKGDFMELSEGFDPVEKSSFLFVTERDAVSTLYDVFNGEVLLKTDASWNDAFHYANGYLYALQGTVYDVYEVTIG